MVTCAPCCSFRVSPGTTGADSYSLGPLWGVSMAGAQDPHSPPALWFLLRAPHSPVPPKQEVPRLLRHFLTDRVFSLVPRKAVDCPCPGPLYILSFFACNILLPRLGGWVFAQVHLNYHLLRRPSALFYLNTVSFTALATTRNYFMSYLYDHLTLFLTNQRALDCLVYCFVFKAPATQ